MNNHSKSKFLTFIFSFIPGLAHMYLGLNRQGLELMILFFGIVWLGFDPLFTIPIIFFYGIFDALQKRDRLVRGEYIDPNAGLLKFLNDIGTSKKKWLGWILIIFGILLCLKSTPVYQYLNQFNIVALLLIGIGIWLLVKERRNRIRKIADSIDFNAGELV